VESCVECVLQQKNVLYIILLYFFFFQAEDGIRYWSVTGVQTCALPISQRHAAGVQVGGQFLEPGHRAQARVDGVVVGDRVAAVEIGRASCRGRGEMSVGAGSIKKKRVQAER